MDFEPFEFPQHLRKLTETNVEQARAAYAQFIDAMTQAMDLCLNAMPQNEMAAGLKVVQGQTIKFGKQKSRRVSTLPDYPSISESLSWA